MSIEGIRRAPARVRAVRFAVAAALVTSSSTTLLLSSEPSSAATVDSSVSRTETISRTHLVDGRNKQDESRTVTLKVGRTRGLQDQQQLSVTWSGAHPTSNYYGDPNASSSDLAEYPMVLLQCHGTAATITPETCWAPLGGERETTTGVASGPADIGTFPAWRLDRYASAADGRPFVGMPSGAPHGCPQFGALAERVVPFVAADGTTYYGSGQDRNCGPPPPEAAAFADAGTASSLPDNATFAMTTADGSGEDKFSVRDVSTNASLGCSASAHCALVAIPIMGISCQPSLDKDDPNASDPNDPDHSYDAGRPDRATAACESGALWPVGLGTNRPAYSVSGQLWWSASNWMNRIVVPLSFAPVSQACKFLDSTANTPAFYGSEPAMQATTEWSAKLCLTKGATSFDHVVAAEPLARTLVSSGAVQAALTSRPKAQGPAPIVQAPVAATGFAISYIIDGPNGLPFTSLRLTPRLLAKLMTGSYSDELIVRQNYPALANNPFNITTDPEFQALNPGAPRYAFSFGAAALFSISIPSDVVYALTSYIEADPEARAWLNGKPDPWGMAVNPTYKSLPLPVDGWPLADNWTMPPDALPGAGPDSGQCEGRYGVQPQPPYLQLISSPVESMLKIAQSIEYAQPGDGNSCRSNPNIPGNTPGSIYTAYTRAPRQFTGQRFVIGVTSLADSAHYSLDTAALETSSTADPSAQIIDGSNRSFVQPDAASLTAAFAQLHADSTTGAWLFSYSGLRSNASAYPGAMLVYADIPTKGLPTADAQAYASILRYMTGPGQTPGFDVGDLPDGYLPLTTANGFGPQLAYDAAAITDVAEQRGLLPSRGGQGTTPPGGSSSSPPAPSSGSTHSGSTTDTSSGSNSGATTPGQGGATPAPAPDGGGTVPTGGVQDGGSAPTGGTGGTASASPSTSTHSGGVPAGPGTTLPGQQVPAALTEGTKSGEYKNLAILLLVLLAAGPLGVPLLALSRRKWASR